MALCGKKAVAVAADSRAADGHRPRLEGLGQPAMADATTATNLSRVGHQCDQSTAKAETREVITSKEERQIQRALDCHSRSRSSSRSRSHVTRPRSLEDKMVKSDRGLRRLSVTFDDRLDRKEFSVSSDEESSGSAGNFLAPHHVTSAGLQQPFWPTSLLCSIWDTSSLSSILSSIHHWCHVIIDMIRQTAVLLDRCSRPTLFLGFRILCGSLSLFASANVILLKKLAMLFIIAIFCLVAASPCSFLVDWIYIPLQILSFACWAVFGMATRNNRTWR